MLVGVGLGVLAILLVMALQVDDWSRDFTTNQAATSLDASDPTLRSLSLPVPPEQVTAAIQQFLAANPAWTAAEMAGDRATHQPIALVRTTRWLRFADDVQVFLQPTTTGTQVDVSSQSRVGKGDLGQNPRNIRELLRALRDSIPDASLPDTRG